MTASAILILAQHDSNGLCPATLSTLRAAMDIADNDSAIDILICGDDGTEAVAQAKELAPVRTVKTAIDDSLAHGLPELVAPIISGLAADYSHILAPATTFGKNILPRAAAQSDSQQISDIIAVEDKKTFRRLIYAGNAIATVSSKDKIKFITVRPTSFVPADKKGGESLVQALDYTPPNNPLSRFVSHQSSGGDRPDLTSALVVISGGRALGKAENFTLIEAVADKLGAAIGASRAAVDAGYAPNDWQVGQTGKIVAPDLYIAVGISGAIQHIAGINDAKVIVAINSDAEAPIFQIADYGLVGDLFQILPEMAKKL